MFPDWRGNIAWLMIFFVRDTARPTFSGSEGDTWVSFNGLYATLLTAETKNTAAFLVVWNNIRCPNI